MSSAAPEKREAYRHFRSIPTRWMDNDVYGHVNNVTYYSYFDTLISGYLIEVGGLDIQKDLVIGITPETFCQFRKSLNFPDVIDAGLAVERLGRSSVKYLVGLFREGDDSPAALGHFVHVFVERESMRPAGIPDKIRQALEPLVIERQET
ncbi:acyl-CoA thioesterase [Aquibaculum sediminis]|uniref:acyl-CoA thioesterase n=1 Tax=Aquibaculum sediminis TaxID=3231907 RepID=UPI00345399F5